MSPLKVVLLLNDEHPERLFVENVLLMINCMLDKDVLLIMNCMLEFFV